MAEVKRGYRKVTLILPVKEYDLLTKWADASDREPGQQAAYLVKQALIGVQAEAIRDAYNGAVDAREEEAELVTGEVE